MHSLLSIQLVHSFLPIDIPQNYHQWLSSQYGLQKLVEHIWKLIGVASTCNDVTELKRKMAELYGKVPVQYTLFVTADNVSGQKKQK